MLEVVRRTTEASVEEASDGFLPSSLFPEPESAVKPALSTALPQCVKSFAIALAVIAVVSAAPTPVAAGQSPAEFISVIGTDVLQEMRADVPLSQKEDCFGQMLRQDADLDGICRLFLVPIGASRALSSSRSSESFL
jgi:hypothetical protein